MPDNRPSIRPNPPEWKPSPDPASIVVPGLDTTASVNDQINQIDQLITLKLQNIDETFSKINTVLSNRILPAVKRYGVATEPVRNAAQFWTSFYEQAAQIRIPTNDDYSTVNGQTTEETETNHSHQSRASQDADPPEQHYEQSISSNESSFMPGNAAVSSTPAAQRTMHTMDHTPADSEASWAESPLVRLDRDIKNFTIDDDVEDSLASHAPQSHPFAPPDEFNRTLKGKGKEQPDPLLRSVLQKSVYMDDTVTQESPAKSRKAKTPIHPSLNPYRPKNIPPTQWNGIVDLRDPNVITPRHGYRSTRRVVTPPRDDEDEDEDLFALPAGMSPPRLYSPAVLRSARKPVLGRTPNKDFSARITKDLVSGFHDRHYATESSMSTMRTPPSVSRYARGSDTSSSVVGDTSMESILRRVGLTTTPALKLKPRGRTPQHPAEHPQIGFATDTYGEPVLVPYMAPGALAMDDDDDDDSFDQGIPNQAFNVLLSASRGSGDDSFDSNNSMDSMDGAPFPGFVMKEFDDSMDDDSFGDMREEDSQEETLFGVPASQRGQRGGGNNMVLHGEQVFGDVGLTEQLDNVAESPTPWPRR